MKSLALLACLLSTLLCLGICQPLYAGQRIFLPGNMYEYAQSNSDPNYFEYAYDDTPQRGAPILRGFRQFGTFPTVQNPFSRKVLNKIGNSYIPTIRVPDSYRPA